LFVGLLPGAALLRTSADGGKTWPIKRRWSCAEGIHQKLITKNNEKDTVGIYTLRGIAV
jgi:hypothetical protein